MSFSRQQADGASSVGVDLSRAGSAEASGGPASPPRLKRLLSGGADPDTDVLLGAARELLHMDAAFVGEFHSGAVVVRHVDQAPLDPRPLVRGAVSALHKSLCARIAEGSVPPVIPDAAAHPVAAGLSVTRELDIRAYVAAPITLPDGVTYGTVCAYRHTPDPLLGDRELDFMRLIASLMASRLGRERASEAHREKFRDTVRQFAAGENFQLLLQPIVSARTGAMAGCEALSRFLVEPIRSPDLWFADAAAAGLSLELQLVPLRKALRMLPGSNAPYISVNLGADVLVTGEPRGTIEELGSAERLVVEITEHTAVSDYGALVNEVAALRALGVRIAVDDTGTGYSGLNHILQLAPDFIKLDRSLIEAVDARPAARALCSALSDFGRDIGAAVIAEGVETREELHTLLSVGIDFVQGYLTGRPQPPPPRVDPVVRELFSHHVLIVDDDAVVRAVLRDALTKTGSTVVGEAGDGLEALEACEQMKPEVIVLDLRMPKLDGLSAMPLLRQIAPRAYIVAVTSEPDQEAASLQLGATAYISKDDVLEVLPVLLNRLKYPI